MLLCSITYNYIGPVGPDQDIAIYDNPVTQHGLASDVTRFESQSFILLGVAFAQRKSSWRTQRQGQREGQTLAFILSW